MKISLIIPTYNAEKYLPILLDALKKQTLLFELIIIDSSSTDNTLQIAKQYTKHIITIEKNAFDHGGTRTKAAQVASGEILVFMTQDALPYNHKSIELLVNIFQNNSIAATYGRQLPYHQTTLFGKHLRLFNYPSISTTRTLKDKNKYGIKTAFLSDSFAAYRKSALKEIGWFKEHLIVGEDNYAGAKLLLAGYSLHYNAQAKVYHSHSYKLTEEFQRYFDIGVFHANEAWLLKEFGNIQGEGNKYIKSELHYLIKHHFYSKIPEFFMRNIMKYIGYKLGTHYKYLPKKISKLFSMHTVWWENKFFTHL